MKIRDRSTLSLFSRLSKPTKRTATIRAWTGTPKDAALYAGLGGACDGGRRATGRSPDIAVNHWDVAIAAHKANHPDCEHHQEDVYKVKPIVATKGAKCRFLWASPTCVHFSRASGKRLSKKTIKIRGLAWSIVPWIVQTRPDVIIVENVVEFLSWGPVCWQHIDGCKGDDDGEGCLKRCNFGRPIKSRAGELFRAWQRRCESFGYSFEFRILKAWEYGAPTTRERVYIVMCANGRAFEWPEPTHVRPELVGATGKKPWRTAAQIIDWSRPCPSIFDRATPHVDATRRRIAKGMRKFVLETASPFLMHLTHGDRHAPHSIDDTVPTVTGANRGEQSLVVPYMIHRSNGEREGQEPRTYDVQSPHPTAVAGGIKTANVCAFIAKAYTESSDGATQASDMDRPIGAVTAQDHNHLVTASLVKFYGTSTGGDVRTPTPTVTGGGEHIGLMTAGLLRYNGQSVGQHHAEPIGTLDANDRYAQVQYPIATEWNDIIAAKARRVYRFLVEEGVDGPWLDHERQLVRLPGTDFVIYDIGMRMLVPRELARAQGFRDWSIVFTGREWRVPTTSGNGPSRTESATAKSATQCSSLGSGHDPSRRALVRARIDLGQNVLELRSVARSRSSASTATEFVSFPLPQEIAASAARLAPTPSCEVLGPEHGRAGCETSNSRSISHPSGSTSGALHGSATMASVDDAATRSATSAERSRTQSTTSQDGPSSPNNASILATLSSFVHRAIASSTLARTLQGCSFDVEVKVRDGYVLELIGPNGKPLTKTDQVRLIGNSVCPDVAEALWRAAMRMHEPEARRAA